MNWQSRTLGTVITLGLVMLSSGRALATYTFTKIADNQDNDFLSFTLETVSNDYPSINYNGVIAFRAFLRSGNSGSFRRNGIYVGDGETIQPVSINENNRLISFGTAIDDQGTVVFRTELRRQEQTNVFVGLFAGNGSELANIFDSARNAGFNPGGTGIRPVVKSNGNILFPAFVSGRGYNVIQFDGDTFTALTDQVTEPSRTFRDLATSNSGQIAFIISDVLPGGGRDSLFRVIDGELTLVATTKAELIPGVIISGLSSIAINDSGTVVFAVPTDASGNGFVLKSDHDTLVVIAEASNRGDKSFYTFLSATTPAINNFGMVAFVATSADRIGGIFTGPNPETDKVIGRGDELFGSTVTGVAVGPRGLNDAGQIAFIANLQDGRQVIGRADPIPPEPTDPEMPPDPEVDPELLWDLLLEPAAI
jgi:hypothetical protein